VEQLDGSKVMFVKSHPAFGSENYQPDRDCFASFRAPARSFSQGLMIEVVEGHISAESYFAFESKRETEKFTNIKDPAIRREFQVPPGQEDKRIFTIHFSAGGGQSTGFLLKLTVDPAG